MSTSSPRVTVALGTYNGARFLREQLDSIFAQTIPKLDVVAYDDGSTDDTRAILQRFAALHSLTLRCASQNVGPAQNFGRAMSLAAGEYVALSDQDDVWEKDKVERCLARMREIEAVVGKGTPVLVYTDATTIDAQGRETSPSFYKHLRRDPTQNGLSRLLAGNIVCGCTTLMNRALVNAALPIPESAAMHDAWVAIVAGALGVVSYLDARTLRYRNHDSNVFGATRPSAKRKLSKALRLGLMSAEYRQRAFARRAQAIELLQRYGERISPEKRELIHAYIGLNTLGFWSRRRVILSRDFLRHSLIDNLELLVRI